MGRFGRRRGWERALQMLVMVLVVCTLPWSHAARPAPGPSTNPAMTAGASAVPVGKDPCASVSPGAAVPLRKALACMKSFPFNLTVANTTIDTLLKTIPHYAFTDIARDSPEPLLPSKVLLEEGLKSINAVALAGKYSTEYDFEQALISLFWGLNDAHTTYRPDCFYSAWGYTHGLVLMGVVKNGKMKIKVAPEEYHQLLDLFPSHHKYIGWEVLEINGEPASKHILSFARRSVGRFKDLSARFNSALFNLYINASGHQTASLGDFYWRHIPPSDSHITFVLTDGSTATKTTTVPYYALYQGAPFTTKDEYFTLNCLPKERTDTLSTRRLLASAKNPPPLVRSYIQDVVSTASLVKERVGIISIPTVSNEDLGIAVGDYFAKFMESFSLGVEQLKESGIERVIFDMTQNGGGYIHLANWLVNALFPQTLQILPTRLRANPLATLAVESSDMNEIVTSPFHWSKYANSRDNTQFTSLNEGFFFPLLNLTYGGVEGEWSQLFADLGPENFPGSFPPELLKPFGDSPPFRADNILILTNGYCGSACSVIATSLSKFYGVRTVTVGGVPGHPQQISNVPGSEVLSLEGLLGALGELDLGSHELAPRPFLRSVAFSFTWRAVYGPVSADTPLEFVFEPSTFNLEYTDETVTSQRALWRQVAKLF